MNISALQPFIITKSDANKLMVLSGRLSDGVFKANFVLHTLLEKEVSYELGKTIEELVAQNGVSPNDTKGLQAFFASLQKELNNLPVVHIILAFAPKENLLVQIHNWFYQNFKKIVILDIAVDHTLIGGGVVSFEGRANDYSLSMRLEQMKGSEMGSEK